jgi:hypothetical protein
LRFGVHSDGVAQDQAGRQIVFVQSYGWAHVSSIRRVRGLALLLSG